jgi:hypothetical protein
MVHQNALSEIRRCWISAQYEMADLRYKQAQLVDICPRRPSCDIVNAAASPASLGRNAPCVDCHVMMNTREWFAICAAS